MCSPLGLNGKEHQQGPAALGEAQHSCCPVPTQPKWSFPVRAAQQTPVAILGFLDKEHGEVHPAAKSRRASSGDCSPGDGEMWLCVLLRQRTLMGSGFFLHLVLHSVCPHSNECMSNKQSVSNCCEAVGPSLATPRSANMGNTQRRGMVVLQRSPGCHPLPRPAALGQPLSRSALTHSS